MEISNNDLWEKKKKFNFKILEVKKKRKDKVRL